jgi:hypothetical protein
MYIQTLAHKRNIPHNNNYIPPYIFRAFSKLYKILNQGNVTKFESTSRKFQNSEFLASVFGNE